MKHVPAHSPITTSARRAPACFADVRKSLLDDPKDLDLLVGGQVSRGIDLELDLELTVRGQELIRTRKCSSVAATRSGGGAN